MTEKMSEKKYLQVRVDLCRNCAGRGVVASLDTHAIVGVIPDDTVVECVCPVCGGSGRVQVRREITVIIEPFNGSSYGV